MQKDRIIRQANEEAHKVLTGSKRLCRSDHEDFSTSSRMITVDTAAVERERQKLRQKTQ